MPTKKKAMLFVLPCILLFSAITFAQADKPSQVKSSGSSPSDPGNRLLRNYVQRLTEPTVYTLALW